MTDAKEREALLGRLINFDFTGLMILLGWDHPESRAPQAIQVGKEQYTLTRVAQKREVPLFLCSPNSKGQIPDTATRQKIETKTARLAREHLLVFADANNKSQLWQWQDAAEGSRRLRTVAYTPRQTKPDHLLQCLDRIRFLLDEEGRIGVLDVSARLKQAFRKDKVTKRFYERFSKEHAAFSTFLKGIPDSGMQAWYVSVMLNRLMFIYFIQKKRFLDEDLDYLRNRLKNMRARSDGQAYYRDFLCPLFFKGFAKEKSQRDADTKALLGDVPYLNGGLFLRHQIEEAHGKDIVIDDAAFERLFDFFDEFQWHLDERPLKENNEINPDVLGYIFEKYINRKQMGAYYTKEDITGYISQNTILPFLLERMKADVAVAFQPDGLAWKLLRDDPDRYIYEAVRRGVIRCPETDSAFVAEKWQELPDQGLPGVIVPESELPDFVRQGMADPRARMYDKRYNLDPAWEGNESLALPTETWREYIERRQRCLELREKLKAGELHEVNDLITHNLNIRQFVVDLLACAGSELIEAAWRALQGEIARGAAGPLRHGISILDPTVGSGAFLFAALNVLYPLYDTCLERMEEMLSERLASGKELRGALAGFNQVIERIGKHPNREYFILKSIIVENLFGVDIMEEACEICKLRLFLKLVAQVESVDQLEPLPDIDFNIRAGNTLVGFANEAAVREAASPLGRTAPLAFDDPMSLIVKAAADVDREFDRYRELQTEDAGIAWTLAEAKHELTKKLKSLRRELDQFLAQQYGIASDAPKAFKNWQDSHKPFHWWAEFYGIVSRGGFDVIIGNPPYVEYSKVLSTYSLQHYTSIACGNLYAFVVERSAQLLVQHGHLGMIVPIALTSVSETASLRSLLLERFSRLCVSNYAIRPAKLFNGVEQRLSIFLASTVESGLFCVSTSKYYQWYIAEREALMQGISYGDSSALASDIQFVKAGDSLGLQVLRRLKGTAGPRVFDFLSSISGNFLFFHRTPGYWLQVMSFEPHFRSPHHIRELRVNTQEMTRFIGAILGSSLFFFHLFAMGNCRNLTLEDVKRFPVGSAEPDSLTEVGGLFEVLMDNFRNNSSLRKRGKTEHQEFDWPKAKPVIDKIDEVLAKHYGFTDEELDFIINYDIKYRLGRGAMEDGEEEMDGPAEA